VGVEVNHKLKLRWAKERKAAIDQWKPPVLPPFENTLYCVRL
jgi:hypothetical protein